MSERTLAQSWDSFAVICLPPEADATLRMFVRRAFYAGATGMLDILLSDVHTQSPDETLDFTTAVASELRKFTDDVSQGKA